MAYPESELGAIATSQVRTDEELEPKPFEPSPFPVSPWLVAIAPSSDFVRTGLTAH